MGYDGYEEKARREGYERSLAKQGIGQLGVNANANALERDTVGSALDRQYGSLLALHEALDRLEGRLLTALETEPPSAQGGDSEPDSKQLMHRVCRTTRGIESASARLDRLIGRVLL